MRVMLFGKQRYMYTFAPTTNFKWTQRALISAKEKVDELNLDVCPTTWPKNCQITPTEWIFIGGEDDEGNGSNLVFKLDTET